jgi:hypothetical protein
MLVDICDIWHQAYEKGALKNKPNALITAKQSYIIFKGFAKVGITALVDEATGYQYKRDKNDLQCPKERRAALPWFCLIISLLPKSKYLVVKFFDAKNLQPFISKDLMEVTKKVVFIDKNGKKQTGYEASILPLVSELYLKARENGVITTKSQLATAQKAEILSRSLARVGIISLVDEATFINKNNFLGHLH